MRTRLKAPSPSMIVALIALVLAMGGTSIAAVNFARNAGAVDGRSAVASTASLKRAAGKLVATKAAGSGRGQVPAKFLELNGANVLKGQGLAQTFGAAIDVVDNATSAPVQTVAVPFFGTLQVSCADQNAKAGIEDPRTTVQFVNQSGAFINYARTVFGAGADIRPVANGTVRNFTINDSGVYQLILNLRGTTLVVNGVVRQDGKGGGAAQCLSYGQAIRVG